MIFNGQRKDRSKPETFKKDGDKFVGSASASENRV